MVYSAPLIQETIFVFQEENGILLTPEEAVIVLDGLSGLFLAYADRAEATPPALAVESHSIDLILHTLNAT